MLKIFFGFYLFLCVYIKKKYLRECEDQKKLFTCNDTLGFEKIFFTRTRVELLKV